MVIEAIRILSSIGTRIMSERTMNLKQEEKTYGIRTACKITKEQEDAYKAYYGDRGWVDNSCDDYVSFVDPSGRWHHMYNRSHGRFIIMDGHWTINLVKTEV